MELARVALSPASQCVKTHVDSIWFCHIPVLLHWRGQVLDEGAPFGSSSSELRSVRAVKVKGWLAWQLQRAYYLDFARAVLLAAFSL
jgi:hypothetical protein